jgi:hypothetical protein
MTSAVEYILDVIEREIPSKILEASFRPRNPHLTNGTQYNVREIIRIKVINEWLIRDLNTHGVKEMLLPLNTSQIITLNYNQNLIIIPKSATANRRIIGLSRVGFFNPYAFMGDNNGLSWGVSEVQGALDKMGSSLSNVPRVETKSVRIVNENTFLVEDAVLLTSSFWAGVCVEADDALSDFSPAYWTTLSTWGVLACKAMCYKNFTDNYDGTFIEGGAELGKLSDMISNWSDTNEQYNDLRRTKFRKITRLNDKNFKREHIKSISAG